MATLAELEDALRNADAAGATDDARRLADAIVAMKAQPADASANQQAIDKRAKLGFLGYYAPDIAMGLRTPIDAGAQMLTRGLESIAPAGSGFEQWAKKQRQDVEAVNAAAREAYNQQWSPEQVTGSSIARGVGESLVGGPLLSKIAPAATVFGRAAQSAGVGAGMGALSTVENPEEDFWSKKGQQIGTGAAIGAATAPAAEVVRRVIAPKTDPNVLALMKEGVTPTPGEILGGAIKRIEEGVVSIPVLGDLVRSAQRRSIEQFNKAMYVRALAPLGEEAAKIAKNAPIGNEGIRIVGDTLSNAYESALARSVPTVINPDQWTSPAIRSAATNFLSAIRQTQGMVPRSQRGDFVDAVNNHVFSKVTPGGTLTPSVAKDAESELGKLSRDYLNSGDGAQRQLGRALRQAQEELRILMSANNPAIAPEIQRINQGWRTLVQLETAGAKQGAKEGVFTPSQYMSAVRSGAQGQRKREFARGEAWNQELGKAGESVLSSKLPDSGTILRGLISAGILGGGGFGFVSPAAGVIGSAVAAPYLPVGQKIAAAALAKRPEVLRRLGPLISESSPFLAAPISGGLLSGF